MIQPPRHECEGQRWAVAHTETLGEFRGVGRTQSTWDPVHGMDFGVSEEGLSGGSHSPSQTPQRLRAVTLSDDSIGHILSSDSKED